MLPILYTFRRCPFAIRARLALAQSGIAVELREIALKSKPQALLDASPKATIPVLVLPSGKVIDQSLDIMRWAYSQAGMAKETHLLNSVLVETNDGAFKCWLDRYKYADRHTAYTQAYSRSRCMEFIGLLGDHLKSKKFLAGDRIGSLDYAILPFVRQFNGVDPTWLKRQEGAQLTQWLGEFCESEIFKIIMIKQQQWQPELGTILRSNW